MRSFFALLLALPFFFGACAYHENTSRRFYRVEVTEPSGLLVAEWVAQGTVKSTLQGYRFHAIERRSGGAYPQLRTYPYGRMVEVTGPNITIARCGEPYWHYHRVQETIEYK